MTHRIRIIFCAALLGCFIGTASVRPALAFNIDIGAIADAVTNIMMDRAKSGWEKIQGKVKQDVGAFNQDAGNYPSSPDIVSRTSGGQPGAKQVAEVPGSGKQAMGGQPGLDNAGRKAQLAAQDAGASAMVLPLADHFGFEMLAAQRLGTVSLQMDNLIETNHFGFETIKTTITEMQKAMLGEIAKILDSLDMKEDVRVAHTDLIENVKANQVDAGNMCKAVSGLIAARAAEEVTRHKRIQRGNKTNAWFSGADPITKQGSVTSNAHTFDRWINLYCDPDGFHDSREDVDNSELCGAKREEIKNLELDKKGQPKLVNADVRPGVTLFTRKTFPNETWDNAAEDLIKNLVNASPIEPMALANLSDSN
ncbi:MAG: hypothetical protein U9N14_07220, partial [Pseudomonadota bacterium]|nr:hypothetical protein [Pseudomonadota bacterium]